MTSTDRHIVVIGAGIIGLSAARSLAEAGVQVTVVDRGPVGGEASGLNGGMIAGSGWGDRPDLEATLRMGSRERFVELTEHCGHAIGLDRTGSLTLIRTESEWAWATETVSAARGAGRVVELVTADELRRLEPAVDHDVLGAILDPLGARAEPIAAMRAIAAEAVAAGVVVETGCTVVGLAATQTGGWEVRTATGRIGADAVVLAAGAWTAPVAALAGLEVPIAAVRGQMWAAPLPPGSLRHAIAAAESALAWSSPEAGLERPPFLTHRDGRRVTRHLYGRQRAGGEVVFGGDRVLRPPPSFTRAPGQVDEAGITVNHRHVAELLPAVAATAPVRTWSGLMPFTHDGRPLLGAVPDRPGLFVAGGLASSGFGRGPMAGHLVAQVVLGHDPGVDLSSAALEGRVTELDW